ncbi:MAG: response regulator [Lachnospiraceae bacterium]|nr:response regulator [Lachnospiraceae bacterium]
MKKIGVKKWMCPLNIRTFGVIAIGIGLNVLGRYIAGRLSLPIWLDSVGTFLAAVILGPFGGATAGFLSALCNTSFDLSAFLYSYVNILVGITAGVTFPRQKRLSSYRVFACGVTTAMVSIIASYPLNIILYDGYTGNLWGDALVDMIVDRLGFRYFAYLLGEGLVDFPDKMIDVILVMSIIGVYQKVTKKKFEQITAILFALCCSLGVLLSSVQTVSAAGVDIAMDYVSVIYDSNDGLASSEMNAVTQTEDGYIWVGGNSGLYRYDGVSYEKIELADSISSVTCLYADEDDSLWIGTNDKGVTRYNTKTKEVRTYSVAEGLPSESVRSIAKSADGDIYVGTVESLAVIRKNGLVGTFDQIEDLHYERSIAVDDNGRVACVTQSGALIILEDNRLKETIWSSEEDTYYISVEVGANGDLWVGTASNTVEHYRFYDNKPVLMSSIHTGEVSFINDLYVSEELRGVCVCGENGMGLIDASMNFWNLTESEYNSSINNACVDYQNNIWYASGKQGIMKLSANIFTVPTRRLEQEVGVVNCLYKDGDELYIGSDDGIIVEDLSNSNGDVISYEYLKYFEGTKIRHMMKDSAGNLWVCTYGMYGLIEVTVDERIIVYGGSEDVENADRFLMSIELSDGTIAAAGMEGIYFISGEQIVDTFKEKDGLEVPQILCLLETDDNKLLACSDGDGVYVLRDGEIIEHIDDRAGLTSQVVLRAVRCGAGYLYVTSNALFYDDRDEIHELTNFPYSNNYDACVTKDKELWVSGSAGIYVAALDDVIGNTPDYDYILLDKVRGLNASITSDGWNYYDKEEEKFYISCSDGVRCIDRDTYEQETESYTICVDDISVNGLSAEQDGDVYQIEAGNGKIEIAVGVLNYTLTDPLVRYYIKGLDETNTTLRQNEIVPLVIGALKPGDYEFHIELLDEHTKEVVKEEVAYIHKDALLYEKSYFRIYTMIVGFTFIAFLVWMLSNYRNLMTIESQYGEIEEARDSAERANNAKSMFLASMSHEIRTPINTVLGMDEMILRESNDPDILGYANDIYSAGSHLLTLINQILDTSKIESGKMEIVQTEYDLGQMIHDMFNMIIHRASEAELNLVVDVDKTMPTRLFGDDMRIKQVIGNLLTNAVKYTKAGTIWLRISGHREGENLLLHVEVEDTGMGIKEEDLPNLFDVYKRLEVKKNHYVEGTGLGLNISAQFLYLMDSELKVSSEYGKGSKFYFDLMQKIIDDTPLGEDFDPVNRNVFAEHHSGGSFIAPDVKLLVVDDNRLNRHVVRNLLKVMRVQIYEASSGSDAIEMCRRESFHIIFMDHMMPEMDGIEALHFIREDEVGLNQKTPIYVLTANAISGAKEKYMEAGFDGFVSKPIVFGQLEEAIRKSIPESMMAPMPQEDRESVFEQGGLAPDDLPSVEGLDWNFAWLHLPSKDLLKDSLGEFYTLLPVQADKLNGFYEKLIENGEADEIFDEYRILVHSMKSLSATVGIISLAGPAKLLEYAAKDKKLEEIKSLHPIFIKEWMSYQEKIKGTFDIGVEDNTEKKQGNVTICYRLAQIIIQALYNMDIDAADMALRKLKEFTFSEEADKYIPLIEAAVTGLDETAAKDGLQKMLDVLKETGGAQDER